MAKYSIRDVFGRFAKMSPSGEIFQRPPPLRDALGHYVSPPPTPPPLPPIIGDFIDTRTRRERDFDDLVSRSTEPGALFDKPDINDYVYDYEPEWLGIWSVAPVEDMTDGQIRAMVDMIMDLDLSEEPWDEIWELMGEDFWEWFREHYGTQ
jgi:hypothetical protein